MLRSYPNFKFTNYEKITIFILIYIKIYTMHNAYFHLMFFSHKKIKHICDIVPMQVVNN